MATIAAEHEASIVATATMPMRRLPLPEAPSVEPGLKPNQPKARMKQPNKPRIRLWPRIGLTEPSLLYLPSPSCLFLPEPRPGPPPPRQCRPAANGMHHARTGEIEIALAQTKLAEL